MKVKVYGACVQTGGLYMKSTSSSEKCSRENVLKYALKRYGTKPEYPWRTSPDNLVLRHGDNRKWYGLMMTVKRENLGISGKGYIDILDIKCDPEISGFLVAERGILPGYHMHKGNWITVLLDGSVEMEQVCSLLDQSFRLTASKKTLAKMCLDEKKEWLIPANPKYFDLEEAFAQSDTISWKQSSNISAGDIIYIYMAAPVSAILYKCEAVEVDIPYDYDDGNVHMNRIMNIRLLHRFNREQMTRERLKEYGVYAVRGPRSVPPALREELEVMKC